MSMLELLIICLLAGLVLAALYVVRLAQNRQQQFLLLQRRISTLKRRINNTENVIDGLMRLDEQPELLKVLCQTLLSECQQLSSLNPDAFGVGGMTLKADQIKQQLQQLDSPEQKRQCSTSFSSDREIVVAKGCIADVMAIIKRLYQFKKLTVTKYNSLMQRLLALHLYVNVNSHVQYADSATERKDKITALSYYRRAQEMLNSSNVQEKEKFHKYSQINEKIEALFQAAEIATSEGEKLDHDYDSDHESPLAVELRESEEKDKEAKLMLANRVLT